MNVRCILLATLLLAAGNIASAQLYTVLSSTTNRTISPTPFALQVLTNANATELLTLIGATPSSNAVTLAGSQTVAGAKSFIAPVTIAGAAPFTVNTNALVVRTNSVGIGTTTPQAALDLGTGSLTGGAYSGSYRNNLDLSAAAFGAVVDIVFPGGSSAFARGVFRHGQVSVIGVNDIFFQGLPLTASGYTVLEGWNGSGLVVGTGNDALTSTAPIILQANRAEKIRMNSSGELLVGSATDVGAYKLQVTGGAIIDSLVVNGGATVTGILSATATLDFDLSAVDVEDLTITVTGAAVGDVVSLGVPNGSVTATAQFTGWVSASDTVTVRCRTAAAGEDPASGTFRATVIKH